MPRKKRSSDDYMNFIRENVQAPAGVKWATEEINLPAVARAGLAIAIHMLEWLLDFDPDTMGDEMDGYLGTEDIDGSTDVNDGLFCMRNYVIDNMQSVLACLEHVERRVNSSVAGALANNNMIQPIVKYFDPPILVAHSKVFLGGFTNGTADQNVGIRIGFTTVDITTDEWLEAHEALSD